MGAPISISKDYAGVFVYTHEVVLWGALKRMQNDIFECLTKACFTQVSPQIMQNNSKGQYFWDTPSLFVFCELTMNIITSSTSVYLSLI